MREPKGVPRPAEAAASNNGLQVLAGDQAVIWPYDKLKVESAGDDRQYLLITLPDDTGPFDSVLVNDAAFFALLSEHLPAQKTFLTGFNRQRKANVTRKWQVLVGTAVGILLLLWTSWWVFNRYLVREMVKRTPVSAEVSWGDQLAPLFLAGKKEIRQGPAFDAAQAIWKRLTMAAKPDNPGYPLRLHLVDDPEVNAFALPGGHVMLLSGLMKKADNAEEVAGVLSHEIQHVLKRHAAARMAQSVGTRLLATAVFGGSDLSGLTLTAQQMGELSYGRDQETEADIAGAQLMVRSGLSPTALGTFFKKMDSDSPVGKIPSFLSTHPDSLKRAKRLETLGKGTKPESIRPFGIPWVNVRKSLAGVSGI